MTSTSTYQLDNFAIMKHFHAIMHVKSLKHMISKHFEYDLHLYMYLVYLSHFNSSSWDAFYKLLCLYVNALLINNLIHFIQTKVQDYKLLIIDMNHYGIMIIPIIYLLWVTNGELWIHLKKYGTIFDDDGK